MITKSWPGDIGSVRERGLILSVITHGQHPWEILAPGTKWSMSPFLRTVVCGMASVSGAATNLRAGHIE